MEVGKGKKKGMGKEDKHSKENIFMHFYTIYKEKTFKTIQIN